jgi:cleavage stimulation factor subunit 3
MKSAQARRLDQSKRVQQLNGQNTSYKAQGSPAPLPREVVNLLSIMPPASSYNISRLSADKMIDLLRRIDLPSNVAQLQIPQNTRGPGQNPNGGMNYNGNLPIL